MNDQSTEREAIKAKIAKLMAMAGHETSNQFEAEAALRQASFLMRKHAIDQADIADRTGTKPVYDWCTVNVPTDPEHPGSAMLGWLGTLGVAIAKFTDTKVSWNQILDFGMCLRFQGDASDVYYAVYLAKHLRDSIRAQSARFVGNRTDRETFRRNMVTQINARMHALATETEAALRAAQVSSNSTALALVSTKIASRNAEFGAPRYGHHKRERGGNAYAAAAGRAAGDNVGFGRPVEGRGANVRIGAGA